MKYAKHRSSLKVKRSIRQRRGRLWLWAISALVVVLVIGALFRSENGKEPVEEELSEAMDKIVQEKTENSVLEGNDTEQISLDFVGGVGDGSGIARRGTSGELLTHVVVAELPDIDSSTFFYEGWLVKPGVTHFFSTGEMFRRADGKWGLVWEEKDAGVGDDIFEYSKVVITLEPREGDPAPAPEHVLEGEF